MSLLRFRDVARRVCRVRWGLFDGSVRWAVPMNTRRPDPDQLALVGESKLPHGVTWEKHAAGIVNHVAKTQPTFTADDLWKAGLLRPNGDARRLGPVMAKAVRDGVCAREPVAPVPTKQPKSHGSPMQVWRSLIYGRAPVVHVPCPIEGCVFDDDHGGICTNAKGFHLLARALDPVNRYALVGRFVPARFVK